MRFYWANRFGFLCIVVQLRKFCRSSLTKRPKLIGLCREVPHWKYVCPILCIPSPCRSSILHTPSATNGRVGALRFRCTQTRCLQRLTSSIPMYPITVIINHGVPIFLAFGDPAMFGSMGLSFEFDQVLVRDGGYHRPRSEIVLLDLFLRWIHRVFIVGREKMEKEAEEVHRRPRSQAGKFRNSPAGPRH